MGGRTVEIDTRPGGDERCFYCSEPVGGEHKSDCVMFTKKVMVRAVIEYEIEVPDFWGKEHIEFHRNEGSWCTDNMFQELEALSEEYGCLCHCVRFEAI